jgi:hypothetical protein
MDINKEAIKPNSYFNQATIANGLDSKVG